ncbi:MAG: hypothetical protein JWN95_35 [Frankiales bacterium]|nr:hypothetical protein [Frankiales bacterium]
MLASCAVLGILVVIAAGLEGTGRFTGARWVPHWQSSPPQNAPLPGRSAANASQPPPPAIRAGSSNPDVGKILLWIAVAIAVILIALLLWRWLAGRPSRATLRVPEVAVLTTSAAELEPEPEAPVIRRGVEQALRLLDEEREPDDAVMRAWLGLQQSAEDSGIVRRPAETPTEFTSRIMSRAFADDRPIRTLLALYLRTRFGNHPVTAADVTRAREALQGLVATWDATAAAAPQRGRRA